MAAGGQTLNCPENTCIRQDMVADNGVGCTPHSLVRVEKASAGQDTVFFDETDLLSCGVFELERVFSMAVFINSVFVSILPVFVLCMNVFLSTDHFHEIVIKF
jgi:hypothetical protein